MDTLKVWYLFHSGFSVRVRDYILIFDYYLDEPDGSDRSLSTGVLDPEEVRGSKVLVFASHKHPDHFNPVILQWKNTLSNIRYFLSSDIPKRFHDTHTVLKPGQILTTEDGITVSTLKSTDAGVAFLIQICGMTIYHAGDLNWWHWAEEDKAWNNNMAARYKAELEKLKEHRIDLAFLTADPRQGSEALWGFDYFIRQIGASHIFPMHFGNDYGIMQSIEARFKEADRSSVIHLINRRGELFEITP